MIGTTLGNFEIRTLIGRGGMGEVYQAKDKKLGRDVAIKVLPEEFAKDADRVARFQREAKLLASLNHPNIAAIYGLEESGKTNFLVLELVEGETLADQIKKGPIAVEEALKPALQIAEALEAAHEKGVIHRDLKPANIKVTPDGKVKVLDFGLAKAFAGEQADLNLSNSPTLSNGATQQGVILGTAAYMSPEQAKGKAVDKRTDVWAFGCVVFEMLTGRSPFSADDVSQTLARVLEREPDFSFLPPNLHPKIIEMLERCLEKDARNRYGSISDARVDIQKALADPRGVLMQPAAGGKHQTGLRPFLLWAIAALGIIVVGWAAWNLKPPERHQAIRFDHILPEGQRFNFHAASVGHTVAVSPDGTQLVYSTSKGLYRRSVDQLGAILISGTEDNPQSPFFSPDGQWLGYWSQADGKLKKTSIRGGAPVVLCDVDSMNGAIWNADDTIIYSDVLKGIMRVSSSAGVPQFIEKGISVYPQVLPDGKWLLFTDASTTPHRAVLRGLKSGERKVLFEGSGAHYLPTGHLVYWRQNSLFTVPFNLRKLEVTGSAAHIVEGVSYYAASNSGTLIYIPAASVVSQRALVWVDRNGKEEPIAVPPNIYSAPSISPDGARLALTVGSGENADIWVWDVYGKSPNRLTFEKGRDYCPLWSPDGKRIVFASAHEGSTAICWKAADGTGEVEKLGAFSDPWLYSLCWAGNAKTLVFEGNRREENTCISLLTLEGDRAMKRLLEDKSIIANPHVSPNGKWIAYLSLESGLANIYVRPFPGVNSGKWQISSGGGSEPRWSPSGRELFYRSGDAMMAVPIETEPVFKPSLPVTLFRANYYSQLGHNWDISPDGKRFLMMKDEQSAAPTAEGPQRINIVLNWFEELKQRVPVN